MSGGIVLRAHTWYGRSETHGEMGDGFLANSCQCVINCSRHTKALRTSSRDAGTTLLVCTTICVSGGRACCACMAQVLGLEEQASCTILVSAAIPSGAVERARIDAQRKTDELPLPLARPITVLPRKETYDFCASSPRAIFVSAGYALES